MSSQTPAGPSLFMSNLLTYLGYAANTLLLVSALAFTGCGDSADDDTNDDTDTEKPSFGLKFVTVPAGTYQVGSPVDEVGRENDDLYRHDVTLTKGFEIATTEITQALYEEITGTNPSYWDPNHDLCPECPVDQVTWNNAAAFTNMLSLQAGYTECYTCTGSDDDVSCTPVGSPYECNGYRLPTEVEWEIAARGGVDTAYPNGGNLLTVPDVLNPGPVTLDNDELLGSFAWYAWSSDDHTHAPAALAANGYGLYDVIGNISEWCHDWHESLDGSAGDITDPYGPSTGESHIVRGGAFNSIPPYLRLSSRNWYGSSNLWWVVGVRVVRTSIH